MDEQKDLHFPSAGLDTSRANDRQPNRPLPGSGKYARTAALARNVRAYEPDEDRVRGGSRGGLVRYPNARVNGAWVVQCLGVVVGTVNPGGSVQQSNSGRVVTLIAVSQGKIKVMNAGDTDFRATTNLSGEEPELNFTGVLYSASNQQKQFFVDGTNYVYYTPGNNTVRLWAATAGTMPADTGGNHARLICTWRGRSLLSGLLLDPQNIFMSRVDDPFDFDYAPDEPSAKDAVALNLSPLGNIGDVVTALIPYSDDVLIVGGDHTIWLIRGDPNDGGRTDLVTNAVGVAWGQAWCMDPFGVVYFFSNRTGVYTMVPGQKPQRISQQIDNLLDQIDTGLYTILLLWDDREQGVRLFLTRTDLPEVTFHYFFDRRSGAWFQDRFASTDLNPLAVVNFDGNLASDRVSLLGCWDGYVRAIDMTAEDDDGYAIDSEVLIGPLTTKTLDDIMLHSLQAHMGEASGDVTYSVLTGTTAEAALAATPAVPGTWGPGRNLTDEIRRSGHAIYVRITSSVRWAMETIRARVYSLGSVRQRGV